MGAAADLVELAPAMGQTDERAYQVRVVVCGSFQPRFGETFQQAVPDRFSRGTVSAPFSCSGQQSRPE